MLGGKSGSGKTTLAINLINEVMRYQIDRMIVVCETFLTQQKFRVLDDLVDKDRDLYTNPDKYTFSKIKKELLQQNDYCDAKGIPRIRTLVFVDDLSGLSIVHGGRISAFANWAIQTPHLECSAIVITQQYTSISPSYRDNSNGIIAFPSTKKDDFILLQNEYGNPGYSDATMKELITEAWRGYGRKDGKEWGKHFLFIHSPARAPIQYFADFNYSLQAENE